jgi:mono/diheme cytochrome c family protein
MTCIVGTAITIAAGAGNQPTSTKTEPFRVGEKILPVLEKNCFSCHGADDQKGDVRLDQLQSLTLDARLDLLNRVQEQLFTGEMPPKKRKQPTEDERNRLMEWISKELGAHGASKLDDKLRKSEYGNYVNHDKLFSGKYKDLPGFTPDRRWLISEFIFEAKMNKLLDHNAPPPVAGKGNTLVGNNNRRANLTNPFLLPTHSGVRYYDTTLLDGGHLLTMLTNAKEASHYIIGKKSILPTATAIMTQEWNHDKILASRESYLTQNVESLLRDLFKQKHESLLPAFVPTKRGPLGKIQTNFDVVRPANQELDDIVKTIKKYRKDGSDGDELILKCEKDWFYHGVTEQTITIRVTFLRGYLNETIKRWYDKVPPVKNTALPESELSMIRTRLLKHRKAGDHFGAIIAKCMEEWREEFRREREKTTVSDETFARLVEELFNKIVERAPTPKEKEKYVALTKSYFPKLGKEKTIERLLQTVILRTDFVYRQEFGEGSADEHGRKMLSPRDASYALAYALTDSSPDKELQEAVKRGKLNTREDYRREVERMLKVRSQYYIIDETVERSGSDSFTNLPIRKLRFFREFFGYPGMLPIFKDNKRFGGNYTGTAGRLVSEADMLVEYILKQDRQVFERLLTTEEFYVYHSGDNAAMTAATNLIRKIYDYFKDKDWKNFNDDQLKAHVPFLKENPMPGLNLNSIGVPGGRSNQLKIFKDMMTNYTQRLGKRETVTAPYSSVFGVPSAAKTRTGKQLGGSEVAKAFNLDLMTWNYPTTQPAKMEHRKGILTHPAWLIAFAANTETDPVRRGKWVREKLLAGTIPDVPVTVDAVIPEDHHKTLRQRLDKVTKAEYCWKCHERMNPLGSAFEMYDDFGRFRTKEYLEHPSNLVKKMPDKGPPDADLRDIYKTLPVDAAGQLIGTGDASLDGDVKDAIDLIEKLAKSAKVRQSIIRHAFRYFMGRNEVLSDSKTLIEADQAYVKSGGSFDAVIISLLTSDSFIYRKPNPIGKNP